MVCLMVIGKGKTDGNLMSHDFYTFCTRIVVFFFRSCA